MPPDPVRGQLGPVFSFMLALDSSDLSAFAIDHAKTHLVEPPEPAPTAEFGQHIV